ncbi:hypothetical protein AAULR_17956, partial [Lacticaseibacillus rhamnosus MTCC 5462]
VTKVWPQSERLPKGTKLRITMSNGQVLERTVNDTGSFAYSNPRQLDVAMPKVPFHQPECFLQPLK